ncbi:MAG: hypothetical protein WCE53_09860 [Candidatus Acidiferrum sp.]
MNTPPNSQNLSFRPEGRWKRKFASSPDVLGKPITLNSKLYTIVGVIPASFYYQNGNFHSNCDAYVPFDGRIVEKTLAPV